MSSHRTQGYRQTPNQLSFSNFILSVDIGGMVFFEWLLADGEIEPDLVDGRLQEEDGELSDDASQFTTKTIDNHEDHDTSDNLSKWPSDDKPPEAISDGGQDAVQ